MLLRSVLLAVLSLGAIAGCGGDAEPGEKVAAPRPRGGGKGDVAEGSCDVLQRCCERTGGSLKPICIETVVQMDGATCEGALVAYECDTARPEPREERGYR